MNTNTNKKFEIEQTVLRKIQPKDDPGIGELIREILLEQKVPTTGSAYADVSLNDMYSTYNTARSIYLILENQGQILGGAGIAPLQEYAGNVCELQKMYLKPNTRGFGFGRKMLAECLVYAKKYNFQSCYLETMPYMKAAQKLYTDFGFEYITTSLGNTGHNACQVWMVKNLNDI